MSTQPLNKNRLIKTLLMLALSGGINHALALSTDQAQNIEVTADRAELDDIKKVSIYTGNVIVIQGSIRMTGDKMTVYHTGDDELQTLIMEGQPATYRQLPDNSSVYDEAEALTIEYHELKNLAILIEQAKIRQERSNYSAKRIEYDTLKSLVKAWGDVSHKLDDDGEPEQKERVKIILKPKKKDAQDQAEEHPEQ